MTTCEVTVYTKEECVQCEYTEKKLAEFGIPFQSVPIESAPHIADELRREGRLQMPYVVTPNGSWNGFKVDELKALRPDSA